MLVIQVGIIGKIDNPVVVEVAPFLHRLITSNEIFILKLQ